jgi:hypothetical protein
MAKGKKKRIRDIDILFSDIEEESVLQNAINGVFGGAVLYGKFDHKQLSMSYLHFNFKFMGYI